MGVGGDLQIMQGTLMQTEHLCIATNMSIPQAMFKYSKTVYQSLSPVAVFAIVFSKAVFITSLVKNVFIFMLQFLFIC